MATFKVFEYLSSQDICANCGRSGGEHCTSGSKSWCYPPKEREEYIDDPRFQTRFSYTKDSSFKKNNPNVAFKRKEY